MRFDRPLCPACQQPARGVLMCVSGRIEIAPQPDGSFARTGQTLCWATERPELADGQHLLRCACGEVWASRRLDSVEPAAADLGGDLPPFLPDLHAAGAGEIWIVLEEDTRDLPAEPGVEAEGKLPVC